MEMTCYLLCLREAAQLVVTRELGLRDTRAHQPLHPLFGVWSRHKALA